MAVGVCNSTRDVPTSDLSLGWYWLGRWVMVFPSVRWRVAISELIFLTCIWAESSVVNRKERRKFLLTAMDVCISCIALTDDSSWAFTAFLESVPLTLFQQCLHSDLVKKKRRVAFCLFAVRFVVAFSLYRFVSTILLQFTITSVVQENIYL